MNMFSKRIQANKINIGKDGRNRGEIQYIFELDSESIVIRNIKTLHTSVERKIDLDSCKLDLFLSDSIKENGLGGAITGGLLFGGAGAVAGSILSKGKPCWIFEVVDGENVELFKLRNETDKKTLEKYLKKKGHL